jgi:hypothetical protein
MNLAAPDPHYYVYRPNPYIDMYDDLRSRHWLTFGSVRPPVAEPVMA